MTKIHEDIIRRLCQPADPIPTGASPRLTALPHVRVVLLDLYGTLFTSAAGEIGTAAPSMRGDAFASALIAAGVPFAADGRAGANCYVEIVARIHQELRAQGIGFPEVDVVEVWRRCLLELQRDGLVPPELEIDELRLQQIAVEYECRTNPVWPMPHSQASLERLRMRGLMLGIISNAQFFTLELFPALLEATPEQLGFHPHLQLLSYRYSRAKPGRYLFERARRILDRLGVAPQEALHMGNDMLNDIAPAAGVGFRTALFAGDRRSLRRRAGDERVAGVEPDVVLTDWNQLPSCVENP